MHKRGLYRHAVSVCPSVTFVNCAKKNKEIFSTSGSHTILVFFHTKRHGNIRTGTPLTGASNAGGVGKKRDYGRKSGFAAYRSTVLSTVLVANCEKQSRDGRSVRRPLFQQDDDEMFVTGSTLYAEEEVNPPDTTPWS